MMESELSGLKSGDITGDSGKGNVFGSNNAAAVRAGENVVVEAVEIDPEDDRGTLEGDVSSTVEPSFFSIGGFRGTGCEGGGVDSPWLPWCDCDPLLCRWRPSIGFVTWPSAPLVK
jgi:hypothetical protein